MASLIPTSRLKQAYQRGLSAGGLQMCYIHQTKKLLRHPDNNVRQCLQFWSQTTSIPLSQFQQTHIDTRTDKKENKRHKLPFGTVQLLVQSKGRKEYGVLFFRKIQLWNEAVLSGIQNAGVV